MKTIYTLLLLFCLTGFAQKQYTFDYAIEYKTKDLKDTLAKSWTMYILTNSKDDTYIASLTEKDSLNFYLIFNDYHEYSSCVIENKKDFFTAEFVNITCSDVSILHEKKSSYTENAKQYDFSNPKDTIVNNKSCITYTIDAINPKRKKRKKIGAQKYIVDKETSFHVPVFFFPVIYDTYKAKGKLPNGICLKKIFYNYLNEPTVIQERVNYLPINKKIIIPADCQTPIKGIIIN
jgi:hypothetical protein